MAGLFTIPPDRSFVDALAAGLLARVGPEPLALSAMTVLLPTRRACRSLREAFLRRSAGRPLLLPRLQPLGDIDAEGLAIAAEDMPALAAALDLPPAIAPMRRQLLLARLIMKRRDLGLTPAQAALLAADLARLLDQAITEQVGFAQLATLVPDRLAAHWQRTVEFLEIITKAWPGVLAAEGAIDPAERRNRVLAAQARAWEERPPAAPVVAAGSTGSLPATAELLRVIAALPTGTVVLPGLDRGLDNESWDAIEESHPQFGLKRLLGIMATERRDVADWPYGEAPARGERLTLVRAAMRPAATSEGWQEPGIGAGALAGLARLDAPAPQDEAAAIAWTMRAALERPERTAALITPDRGLARRVAAALGRWGIAIDDSAGEPLAETPVGAFLRLVAGACAAGLEPVRLLALLKHPLTAVGQPPAAARTKARELELKALRGPRPPAGIDALAALIRGGPLMAWLEQLRRALKPLLAGIAQPAAALPALLQAHVAAAEALAVTADEPGPQRLWRGPDGEAAAAFISAVAEAAGDFPRLAGSDYPELVDALMQGAVVRPQHGGHPRLAIWGPLEARLQQADLLILGGLNEGTWPKAAATDPWMSRPMRRDFGLPGVERRIGLAAHDVAQALAAPEVLLTRSERVEGAPTVPSRWLARLDAVLGGAGLATPRATQALACARLLDQPAQVQPVRPPEPRPPVAARPRELSVSDIATWTADPYALYARRVLGLKKLEPLAADIGAPERGQVIHDVLHRFIAGDDLSLDRLIAMGREEFDRELPTIAAHTFWWPRFERIAAWFVAIEQARRAVGVRTRAAEVKGRQSFAAPGGPFVLNARADRIDRRPDGSLVIVDYKTGRVPTHKEIAAGYAPQLPLEAVIAAGDGFDRVPPTGVAAAEHWQLSPKAPAIRPVEDLPQRVAAAEAGLARLVVRFDDAATPYLSRPRPAFVPRNDDYDHLARVREWSAGQEDDE